MKNKTCFYDPTVLNKLTKDQLIAEIDRLVKRIRQLELGCEVVVEKLNSDLHAIPEEDF